METKKKSKLEIEIEKVTAQAEKELNDKIEKLKLDSQVDGARSDLKAKLSKESKDLEAKQHQETKKLEVKQKNEKATFKAKYGVSFENDNIDSVKVASKENLSSLDKARRLIAMTNSDGTPKYSLSPTGELIGSKGEVIKSTIAFKDKYNAKQTLAASYFISYFPPEF